MAKKCISNCVEPNTPILNPINLELKFNSNNTNICITKPYKENNKLKEYKKNCIKSENPSIEAITNIMVNPVLQFGSEYILFFYNINTINDLMKWIYDNLKLDTPLNTILRILNCFLKIQGKNIKKIDSKIYSIFHEIYFYRIDKDVDKNYNQKKFFEVLVKTFKNSFEEEIDLIKFNFFEKFKKNLELYYRK